MFKIKACQDAAYNMAASRSTRRSMTLATCAVFGLLAIGANAQSPKPIGGGFQINSTGPTIHYNALVPVTHGGEFSTIGDFSGILGATHVENWGTMKDKTTGNSSRIYFKTDIRFMQGWYVADDGNTYYGTYSVIALRLQPARGQADFHVAAPGVAGNGLVWTIPLDPNQLTVNMAGARADMHARNQPLNDYSSFNSALTNGPSQNTMLNYLNVHWRTQTSAYSVNNASKTYRGDYKETHAIAEFQFETPSFIYTSDVDSKSHEDFAILGQESNGAFF